MKFHSNSCVTYKMFSVSGVLTCSQLKAANKPNDKIFGTKQEVV